eukprot:TRINITY_DN23460_c0_g1_i1.p1 TRINITY_DN23460_c0_g1~~TRINITY_DN23460_c0_g1_i1.p1  ORF type:complete len:843 (-),score=83.30 TRINITY_DN23460_c0_g1_i1:210-2738(-)
MITITCLAVIASWFAVNGFRNTLFEEVGDQSNRTIVGKQGSLTDAGFAFSAVYPAPFLGKAVTWAAAGKVTLIGTRGGIMMKAAAANVAPICTHGACMKVLSYGPIHAHHAQLAATAKVAPIAAATGTKAAAAAGAVVLGAKIIVAGMVASAMCAGTWWLMQEYQEYQEHLRLAAAQNDDNFCSSSTWTQDPWLQEPDTTETSHTEFVGAWTLQANRGMPKCTKNLKRVAVATVCAEEDLECMRAACQQACCNTPDCSFFQFSPRQGDFICMIGDKSVFSPETCESRWHGEERVGSDNVLTTEFTDYSTNNSGGGSGGGGGPDGVDFENEADSHNLPIQIPPTRHDELVESTAKGASELIWYSSATLSHEPRELVSQTVPPVSTNGCLSSDSSPKCLRQGCRAACDKEPGCTYFQFQAGSHACYLGFGPATAASTTRWYGGLLSDDETSRSCKDGQFACPASNECVPTCKECAGFSRSILEDRKCVRSPAESICDAHSWHSSYLDVGLTDAWCWGLSRKTIEIAEDTTLTPHDVCREACCNDATCTLYQFVRGWQRSDWHGYKQGDRVECWLGHASARGDPTFSCEPRILPGRAWEGAYLSKRGCPKDTWACPITGSCVQHCAAECYAASVTGDKQCLFSSPTLPAGPKPTLVDVRRRMYEVPESVGLKNSKDPVTSDSNVSSDSIMPVISLDSTSSVNDEHYYQIIPEDGMDALDAIVALETKLSPSSRAHTFITPDKASPSICGILTVGAYSCDLQKGACVCRFATPQSCSTWLSGPGHARPVYTSAGKVALFSWEGCTCTSSKTDNEFSTCAFEMMVRIPSLRAAGDGPEQLLLPANPK